jgi:hypothetical protein
VSELDVPVRPSPTGAPPAFMVAVARVCHRVGAAMREVSALPTAVAKLT